MGLCSTRRNFTSEIPIALLTFIANLKDTFGSCGVREIEAVRGLQYMLSDKAKKVHEVYAANKMRTNATLQPLSI